MSADRHELAQAFLREAVYRSRERQAASVALARPKPAGGTCGLGERAAIALDLSARAEELFAALWPAGLDDAALEQLRTRLADWVVEQDALDRKRNHFLKAFRQKHGFDRDAYAPELLREFEDGLARVNAEETSGRAEAARAILAG